MALFILFDMRNSRITYIHSNEWNRLFRQYHLQIYTTKMYFIPLLSQKSTEQIAVSPFPVYHVNTWLRLNSHLACCPIHYMKYSLGKSILETSFKKKTERTQLGLVMLEHSWYTDLVDLLDSIIYIYIYMFQSLTEKAFPYPLAKTQFPQTKIFLLRVVSLCICKFSYVTAKRVIFPDMHTDAIRLVWYRCPWSFF